MVAVRGAAVMTSAPIPRPQASADRLAGSEQAPAPPATRPIATEGKRT